MMSSVTESKYYYISVTWLLLDYFNIKYNADENKYQYFSVFCRTREKTIKIFSVSVLLWKIDCLLISLISRKK